MPRLEDWKLERWWLSNDWVIWGYVHDDIRFEPDKYIHTSKVIEIDWVNMKLQTLNTKYDLTNLSNDELTLEIFNTVKNIKTSKDIVLNIRHENLWVRKHCEKLLKRKEEEND